MNQGRTLLIVDDDPQVTDFLCESLGGLGYQVQGETDPVAALALVLRGGFDLVIVDVEMPRMRGPEFLERVLNRRPEQLVLMITAFGSIETAVAAVRAGACDFVTKPFRIEVLDEAISRALKERRAHRQIVRLRADGERPASARAGAEVTGLVAKSAAMHAVMDGARRAARSAATVLLTGETGTGKGAVAAFIHGESGRRSEPFVSVNCAAIPRNLMESEFFGVRRGAFTDAREDRPGLFVAAGRGTLFLDEIGDLPLEIQAKLLHCLEAKRVRPVGGASEQAVEARIIAATHRPLEALLESGEFREDLYYRLNVIRIEIPPLRARVEDIPALVDRFLSIAGEQYERPALGITETALSRLIHHPWPGNVRELANVVERAVAMGEHDSILPEDLAFSDHGSKRDAAAPAGGNGAVRLEDVERAHVRKVLEACGGNKAQAARTLGINRRTLYRKLEEE